jgi:hypothetical protein
LNFSVMNHMKWNYIPWWAFKTWSHDVYRISYNTKKHNWEYILIRSYTIKTVWVLVFSVIYKLESRQLIQPLRLFCFAIEGIKFNVRIWRCQRCQT